MSSGKNRQPIRGIAPEGVKPLGWLAALLLLSLLLLTVSPWFHLFVVFFGLALLMTLWFYRDPERSSDAPAGSLLSPADGQVVEILPGSTDHTGETIKIGIFMSPFNVHVNRIPYDGKVVWSRYHPGKKWAASAPKASEVNERYYLGLDTALGPLVVCQIAGLLARRIRCNARRGDTYSRGERYGMILLGSKVDLYLPPNTLPTVQVGDRVKAGATVVAEVVQ